MISQNYRDKSKDLHLLIEAVNSNAVPKHGRSPPGGGEESMKDRKSSTGFMNTMNFTKKKKQNRMSDASGVR